MAVFEENIRLRFVGNDIKPTKIKVGELGAVLLQFEKTLKGIILSNFQGLGVDEKDYYLTLDGQIRNESAAYPLIAISPDGAFKPALDELNQILHSRNSKSLNEKTIESINKFTGWLRTHKCDAELYFGDELIATVPKSFSVNEDDFLIKEFSTLHGQIIDVGKEDPRVEIKLLNGDSLFFPVKIDLAIDLGKFLFKKISLIGRAKIYPDTYKIKSFELQEYTIVHDGTYKEKFEKLRGLIGRDWDEIEDPVKYLELNE